MSQVKFSKQDVAAKYEIVGEVDVKINTVGYDGMLSNAPLATVEAMVKRESSLVKEIAKTAAAKP